MSEATKEGMADVPDTPGETGHRLGGGLQRAQKSLHFDNVNVSTDVTRAADTSGGETDDRDVSLDESSSSENDPSIVGSAVDSGAASSAPAADAGRPTESNMSALRTLTPTEFDALLRMFIALGTKYGSKKQTERTKWDGYSPGVHFTSNAQLKVFCGHGTALEMLYRVPESTWKQMPVVKNKKHGDGVRAYKKAVDAIHDAVQDVGILNIRFIVSFVSEKAVGATIHGRHSDGGSDHGALLVATSGNAAFSIGYNGDETLSLDQPTSYTANARWHGRGSANIHHTVTLATTGDIRIAALVDLDKSPDMATYTATVKDSEDGADAIASTDRWDSEKVELLKKLAEEVMCKSATNSHLSVKKTELGDGFKPLVKRTVAAAPKKKTKAMATLKKPPPPPSPPE